jgi:hypothetical protein
MTLSHKYLKKSCSIRKVVRAHEMRVGKWYLVSSDMPSTNLAVDYKFTVVIHIFTVQVGQIKVCAKYSKWYFVINDIDIQYLIFTLSFETWSAFRVILYLHFEDSGKSLLS